jgi:hypothetical protein
MFLAVMKSAFSGWVLEFLNQNILTALVQRRWYFQLNGW